ncbi:MAG TPA: putative sulfate exporter family transporter, partial [Candidatus Methylomirabilis sp.]
MLKYVPGFALILAISFPARFLQGQITVNSREVVSAVSIAIILGIVIRNLIGVPDSCKPGTSFAVKRILRVGIALMGAQLSLGQVLKTGAAAVFVVATCIVLAILVVRFISMRMGMSDRLGTLIGVGTSICGVSAIVATAPLIESREEETSLAVATITVFGLVAVLVYPLLGHLWQLSDTFFGTWAGTAVNDTSQVVATGLIYSQKAGEIATVVKLTRNLFMAPVIVGLSWFYLKKRQAEGGAAGEGKRLRLHQAVPLFVLGFVGMAILNSLGAFAPDVRQGIQGVSQFLIVSALAGVGLETH